MLYTTYSADLSARVVARTGPKARLHSTTQPPFVRRTHASRPALDSPMRVFSGYRRVFLEDETLPCPTTVGREGRRLGWIT